MRAATIKSATITQAAALICAPTRVEARQLRAAGVPVLVSGVGPAAARRAAVSPALGRANAVAVVGVAGGLAHDVQPGDVVVADRVRGPDGEICCPAARILAAALGRAGLTVRVGTILSSPRVVGDAERRRLAAEGAVAVDMESAWLLSGRSGPLAAIRVIADDADSPLLRPVTLAKLGLAVRTLQQLTPALQAWADALGPRRVLLAGPRSFCAGVVRAIEIVDRALEQRGAPIYVRKEIVHNRHVVDELRQRGAVFVDELDDVPGGSSVVFSAHGVAPAVRTEADARGLQVIDATCPLVSKVHAEARRFTDDGDTVIFIGHAGHDETIGTMGERPQTMALVQDVADAQTVQVADPDRVSYLVQTTLAADEVAEIITVLKQRFPALRGPASDDICYATTNRQRALQAVAQRVDLCLVVGSANSSNSRRLVERAERMGTRAELIDDVDDLRLDWLAGVETIGLTAGASAPMSLVDEVVAAIGGLGGVQLDQIDVATESTHFTLPKELKSV